MQGDDELLGEFLRAIAEQMRELSKAICELSNHLNSNTGNSNHDAPQNMVRGDRDFHHFDQK